MYFKVKVQLYRDLEVHFCTYVLLLLLLLLLPPPPSLLLLLLWFSSIFFGRDLLGISEMSF